MKKWTKERLAAWLAARGVGRNRLLWQLVYALSPAVAGMVSTFSEAMQPENQVVWQVEPDGDGEDSMAACLELVSEIINRAPAPMGLDGYLIVVTRLGALPGDENGLLPDWVDATLNARPALEARLLQGDRWHDWKRGDGRQALRTVLEQFQPHAHAPVTLMQVAVTGAGVVQALHAFDAL